MNLGQNARLIVLGGVGALALVGVACSSAQPAASPTPAPAPAPAIAMEKKDGAMMESKGPAMAMGKKDGAMMRSKDSAAMTEKRDGTMMESKDGMMTKLPDQQFAAHFVGSNPRHGTALAQAPAQLVLNFNFTLSEASSIMVTRDGVAVSASKPTFSNNKLTMSTTLPASAGKGLYQVDYKACWPDNSCHSGRFAYTVGS